MRATQLTPAAEIAAVDSLYQLLPEVGQEKSNISANRVALDINLTTSQTARIIKKLESLNILSRRLDWAGGRKASYWKLLVSKEEAFTRINNTPTRNNSLRDRILLALENQGKFDSLASLVEAINEPGETTDYRAVSVLLNTLQQQGKVYFKRDNSGRKGRGSRGHGQNHVVYDISLGKMHIPTPVNSPQDESSVIAVRMDPATISEPEAEPEAIMDTFSFPLIQSVVMRRENLERAAYLADEGGQKEIATALLEKAEESLNPFEQEVINLWNLYQECKS